MDLGLVLAILETLTYDQLCQLHYIFQAFINQYQYQPVYQQQQAQLIQINMGNKTSSKSNMNQSQLIFQKLLPTLPESYVKLQQSSVFQHPQQISLREYIIMLNKDEQDSFVRSLRLRKEHPNQLVQIMYGELMQDQKQYKKVRVYVEYIKASLQQFINVHFSDLMPIFYKAFKGFKILFQQFGSFMPDPRMIGFNELAEVKIWAHDKYSKSKPKISYDMMDQQKMVHALIQIFSSKIDIGSLPIDSHRRKFDFQAKTFDEALQLIQSQVQSVELIPKYIKSIQDIFQSGRKFDQNDIISMNSEFYHKGLEKLIKFKYSDPNPNDQRKKKINFTFQGQSSTSTPKKSAATSLPKINFTTNTTPKNSTISSTNSNKNTGDTKIVFTTSNSTINTNINTNGNNNNNSNMNISKQSENRQQSRITIINNNSNNNGNSTMRINFTNSNNNISINTINKTGKQIVYQGKTQRNNNNKNNGRSNSLIKFTYD